MSCAESLDINPQSAVPKASNPVTLQVSHVHSKPSARTYTSVSIIALIGIVGWSLYDVGQLQEHVDKLGKRVAIVEDQLDYATRLAKNADRYSHSHYSDVRLKTDVQNLSAELTKVLRLRPVTFKWNAQVLPMENVPSGLHVGFIAQEIEQIYPELVETGPDGYKRVDYAKLTPILVRAIQEQQAIINALQLQMEELQQQH